MSKKTIKTATENTTVTTETAAQDEKKVQVQAILTDGTISKSESMRRLYDLGIEIGEIANLMHVRYNFVYNVVSQAARTSGVELRTKVAGETVKSKIVGLLKEGVQPTEVSKQLHCNITMVYKYRKEFEAGLI